MPDGRRVHHVFYGTRPSKVKKGQSISFLRLSVTGAKLLYPIGPPDVFAMAVPVLAGSISSGSPSFGITNLGLCQLPPDALGVVEMAGGQIIEHTTGLALRPREVASRQ